MDVRAWFRKLTTRQNGYQKRVPLKQLSQATGIPVSTLSRAALDTRLDAERVAHVWTASPQDVDRAVARGDMRKRDEH